ncbi:MAG: 2-oxo acid dehydrogenase subunit E2 [Clostridia bacterium]|nr:2-oxo acid dehydrogenase subunit E2 [Clostridia bacterium]
MAEEKITENMEYSPSSVDTDYVLPPLPEKRKRRVGDRYDGYRVRKMDLPFYIIPNIMRSRLDSQIFFEETIDITELERYVREKRATDMPDLRLVHVVLAAVIRMFALRPRLNRFVAGKKIYAHNNIRASMTVKRALTDDGEETEILPVFSPYDTLRDVMTRFNNEWREAVAEETKENNITDKVIRAVGFVPTWLKSFVVFSVRNLDKVGLMPKVIYKASPFHSSFYITDVGSLGIDSIYHHLYEFGTTSCFVAMGKKKTEQFFDKDGKLCRRKVITFRFVLDERICDGHYYASSIKQFRWFMKHPERLEMPPEELPNEI